MCDPKVPTNQRKQGKQGKKYDHGEFREFNFYLKARKKSGNFLKILWEPWTLKYRPSPLCYGKCLKYLYLEIDL
jgi:hypothetical protein